MDQRMLTEAEMQARLPVWDAIADLFLDTVLDDLDRERIARALAASPFSADALEAIYRYEVAPAVHRNLKVVAGEWAGFGHEWLREHVGGSVARRGPFWRWWADSRLGRWWMTSGTEQDWRTVLRRVADLRGAG